MANKSKNICTEKTCPNHGRYCRLHLNYIVPERKDISKVSEGHKEVLKKYKVVRAKYLREHPFCEAKIEGCTGVSIEVHHRRGKVGEADYLNPDFYLAVCRHCHNVIEANPAFSRQNGFSISRLSKDIKNKRA